MAKCFINGIDLLPGFQARDEKFPSKKACLKIYRDKDEKELSISFDNSIGAFGDECRRIEAVIFQNKDSNIVPSGKSIYITSSLQLSMVISYFLAGDENLLIWNEYK